MYKYSIQYFCDKLVSVCEKQRQQNQVSANGISGERLKKNVCFSIDNTDLQKANAVSALYLEADPDDIKYVEVSIDYTPDPEGRALLEQEYAQPIDGAKARIYEIETQKERILLGSVAVRLARYLEQALFWPLVILIVVLFVFCLILVGPKSLLFPLLFGFLSFWWWIEGLPKLRRKLEERVATHAGAIWTSLGEGIQFATANLKKIEAERARKLTAIFDRWSTYPPDWEYRREAAKERDKYSCTKCGYPEGFKRRSRQLHVHHKKPVSNGGTHEIENLITLCHICHRKVDASHSRVRRTPSPPRRSYR